MNNNFMNFPLEMEQSNWCFTPSNKNASWSEQAPFRMSQVCNESTNSPPVWNNNVAFRQSSSSSYGSHNAFASMKAWTEQTTLRMNNVNMQQANVPPFQRCDGAITKNYLFTNDGQTTFTSMSPLTEQTSLRFENAKMQYANVLLSLRSNEAVKQEFPFSNDGLTMKPWVEQAPLGVNKAKMQNVNLSSAERYGDFIRRELAFSQEGQTMKPWVEQAPSRVGKANMQDTDLSPVEYSVGVKECSPKTVDATLTKSQRKKRIRARKKKLKSLEMTSSAQSSIQGINDSAVQKDKKESAENLTSLKMAIIKDSYPSQKLSRDDVDLISKCLLRKLDHTPMNDPLPSINKTVFDNGALIMHCSDLVTTDWIKSQFDDNKEVISGSVLKVLKWNNIKSKVKVAFRTRDTYTKEAKILLRRLQRLNPQLKSVMDWKTLDKCVEPDGIRWVFEISGESAESIKRMGCKASTGIDTVFLKVMNKPRMNKKQEIRARIPRPPLPNTCSASDEIKNDGRTMQE